MEINVIPENFEAPQDNFPFPSPFSLSSTEWNWCLWTGRQQKDMKIVFIKRRHLEENLKTFENEIGMGESERKEFLDYWCSPVNRSPSEIRAELDECFNLRARAESWMKRAKPNTNQPKSRLEQYAESARQFFQGAQTVSSGSEDASGFGYADIPDEQ